MKKNILIASIYIILIVSTFFILQNKNYFEFNKCENAKEYTFKYNPEFYSEEAAEFHNKIKIEVLKECGLLNG